MGTIFGFNDTQTSKTLKGQGLKEMFPFAREPLTITKDIDEGLRSFSVVCYIYARIHYEKLQALVKQPRA
ncbi:hypothetical protein F442_04097 [Phytophthora nicotianae P10297]|uniref:Uncharacterized protein n=1 Tax=Phytophthora nicotianae P10297 TaxID=1317064 RepID=W2ZUI2_PHYNI|nr:hypothetical protein F442_04097 [Phytophthora nicotianae P10297]